MTFNEIAFAYRNDRPALIVALQALPPASPAAYSASRYLADRFAVQPAISASRAAAADALFSDLFGALA